MRLRATALVIAALLTASSPGLTAEKEGAKENAEGGEDTGIKVDLGRGGVEIESPRRAFEFQIGGRVQVDAALHREDSSSLADGAEIRRARLYFKGKIRRHWAFKSQLDFAGSEVSLKDLYLRYSGPARFDVTVGNFKEPFSLEDQISSKNITFVERALPIAAFSPSRALGVAIHRGGERGSLSFGIFGDEMVLRSADRADQGVGAAARATWAPLTLEDQALHLGISAEYREPGDDQEVRFEARPESAVSDEKLLRTRRLDDVRSTSRYGLEIAAVSGPLSFQGEYLSTILERHLETDANLDGWYAYLSWFPTGESRPYDAEDGAFGRIKPNSKNGAWEIGLRLSSLDLDDADIRGGREDNLTLGLSWYASSNLRLMANYTRVESQRRGENDDPDIFQVRAQLEF